MPSMEQLRFPNPEMQQGRKPLVAIHGHHDEGAIYQLVVMEDQLRGLIAAYPEGKIAAIIEDDSMLMARARMLTERVKNGWLPTEAFLAETVAFREAHKFPIQMRNRSVVQNWMAAGHVIENPFTREQYRRLDWISEDYPKKLVVYPEESTTTIRRHDIGKMDDVIRGFADAAKEGLYLPEELRAWLHYFYKENWHRNLSMRRQTSRVLDEPSIAGVVRVSGIGHADLFEAEYLSNANIINIIADGEDGEYVLNPLEQALFSRRGFTSEQSEFMTTDEARMLLMRTIIWKHVSQAAKNSKKLKLTEQDVRRYVWDKTRDLTLEHSYLFEEAMADPTKTVQTAIKEVFAWEPRVRERTTEEI